MDMSKKVAINLKNLFDSLVAAGFTEKQATEYLGTLMSKLILGRMKQKQRSGEQFVDLSKFM